MEIITIILSVLSFVLLVLVIIEAQKNIQTGMGQLDVVIGTRAIQRQLNNVETIPTIKEKNISPEIIFDAIEYIIEK